MATTSIKSSDLQAQKQYDALLYLDDTFMLLPDNIPLPEYIPTLLHKWDFNTLTSTKLDTEKEDTKTENFSIGKHPLRTADTNMELQNSKKIGKIYNNLVYNLSRIFQNLRYEKTFSKDRLFEMVHQMISSMKTYKNYMLRLQIYGKSTEMPAFWIDHALKTCALTIEFSLISRLPYYRMVDLATASLLHNIGMLQIPNTLYTQEQLNDKEKQLLNLVPMIGYRILQNLRFSPVICNAVLHAKEHVDGSGNPQGLDSPDISEEGKIIAICSKLVEWLTLPKNENVNYQSTFRAIFTQANKYFDVEMLQTLITCLTTLPYGAIVRLSTNHIACITDINKDNHHKAVVRVLTMPNSTKQLDTCVILDLLQEDITISEELPATEASPFILSLKKEANNL